MNNIKRYLTDKLCLICGLTLFSLICFLFSLDYAFVLWLLALVLTIFITDNRLIIYLFEKRHIQKMSMKAIDHVFEERALTAKSGCFLLWKFETEDGRFLILLDPTLVSYKSIGQRKMELKDKNFIVSYYKHSKLIIALEEQ